MFRGARRSLRASSRILLLRPLWFKNGVLTPIEADLGIESLF